MIEMLSKVDWSSFSSALIGGFLTLLGSLWAVDKTHKNDLEREEKQEEILINGFIQSIQTEIEILWKIYYERMGTQIESLKQGDALLYYYPIMQEYFTIYNGSSFLVGRIKNEHLRNSIVESYGKARGLIDCFRFNNEMIHKYENLDLMKKQAMSPIYNDHIKMQMRSLVDYAPEIIKAHNETKASIQNFFFHVKDRNNSEHRLI